MDLNDATAGLKALLLPDGENLDVKALQALMDDYKKAGDAADSEIKATRLTPQDRIDYNTQAVEALEPAQRRRNNRILDAADRAGQIGSREYQNRINAAASGQLQLLNPMLGSLSEQRQADSGDYNTLMDKSFDARDKDREFLQRGQTLNFIKHLVGGGLLLFN